MSNLNIYVIAIAVLAILAAIFFIHYQIEENIKKAFGLLVILILTVILGAFADEIVKRVDNEPFVIWQKEPESVPESIPENVPESINDEKSSNTIDFESIGRFFYSLTPMDRKIVKERDKTFSPDWLLLLLTILGSAVSIYIGFDTFGWVISHTGEVLCLVTAVIFSFAHFYIIFFTASLFSKYGINTISIYGIIIAIIEYLVIIGLSILIGLADLFFTESLASFCDKTYE